ncbi:uncharacterized protein LOC135149947 [Daucus carota subsp. sativus]|uniref:uncharacterized protein LOC135149947 n=1 Tax=Daucus carota subsp. sativus TaxID=79200 RepID=UPI003082AA76
MSTTAFEFNGAKFVTNNYSAILDNDEAPKEFHLIQDFLAHSELMYALTEPELISPSQVLTLWRSANYDDGGENGCPSLTCNYEGQEYAISPATIRKALHLPEEKKFDSSVPTQTLRDMMIFLGRKENMNIVYYSRFCQLIFSYCFPDVPLPEDGNELPFKITKRAFTDLIKKDSKKNAAPVFAIPVTVQDKLKLALPDKYGALFSDDNIPQPPSPAHNPIPTADPKPTSGSSQQGPVVISSPKRVLRSSRSPSKQPSPPPRKRRFLQKISDSESEEDIPPPPPAKKLRKKIKATSITDLTVEPPQSEDPKQPLIPFSDQSAEPLLIEPISAVPLDIAAADQQMSESTSDHNDQSEGTKSVEENIAADILVSETVPDIPNQSEDAQIELVLQMIQDSLLQPAVIVAAPAQEITEAANSDAATEALEETSPERVDSPVKILSPVRESTPFTAPAVPSSPIPFSEPARRKICHLTYNHRMCRTTSPSVEDRLTSIEATQASMNYTLADLSASVAQLVQVLTSADVKKGEKTFKDKCKPDQQLKRKKPDDDEAEKGEINKQQKLKQLQSKETKKNSREAASSERPPRESQKHRSMELTVVTQAQNITKAVRDSDALSKEIDLVNSEVEKKKENLLKFQLKKRKSKKLKLLG